MSGVIKKALIYVVAVIISFLIIPEILFRVISPDHLAWLGFVTSFGGAVNPLLAVMIFMGVLSIILGIAAVYFVDKIYHSARRSESK